MKREDKMKNRNIKIFSFVLCLVAMLFALGLNRTSAETPGVTVSGKLVDTIKNIKVTNNEVATLIGNYNNGQHSELTLITICLERMLKQEIQL